VPNRELQKTDGLDIQVSLFVNECLDQQSGWRTQRHLCAFSHDSWGGGLLPTSRRQSLKHSCLLVTKSR